MTPKTQSVCKHVVTKGSLLHSCEAPCNLPKEHSYHQPYPDGSFCSPRHKFKPVAEPASTGEPPKCSCPCHKGESVICNCGGGFECEYINSIPVARPSEPSAPRKMIDVGGKEHDETTQCKYSDCHAAPQPVSGLDPRPDLDWPLDAIRKNQSAQPVSGDAAKVEEIARIIHGKMEPIVHEIEELLVSDCRAAAQAVIDLVATPASTARTDDSLLQKLIVWLEDSIEKCNAECGMYLTADHLRTILDSIKFAAPGVPQAEPPK